MLCVAGQPLPRSVALMAVLPEDGNSAWDALLRAPRLARLHSGDEHADAESPVS